MSAVFSERLAPLRARLQGQRPVIRPVSRVRFELTDKSAFEVCIDLSLKWMTGRAQAKLPAAAWRGESFDVTDVLGANPTKAVRISASDGDIWAARLDFPDPENPRTWVTEFFAEHRKGHLSRFGTQLTCVVRGESPPFDFTRPTLVRHILDDLSAEADGWQLTNSALKIEASDVLDFVNLLYLPNRRLPVIAISEGVEGTTHVAPNELAQAIAGAAHIVHLSTEASWELTRIVTKRMSAFNGAVRMYAPGLKEDEEDPYQHPLWLLRPEDNGAFTKSLASRVLPYAFLTSTEVDDFPRFAALREAAAKQELRQRPAQNKNEQIQVEVELLKLELEGLEDDRDAWQALAQDEETKRIASEAELERLKDENRRLEAKAAALEHSLNSSASDAVSVAASPRTLTSYDDLEEWAEEVLGEKIYIHQAALRDCKKNGHDNMLVRISAALIVIRDYVVPARLSGGLERYNIAKSKLTELGMEDSPCFVNRDDAKRTTGYSVQYEGTTQYLYEHIKYGNGYDNSNQIRIYYFWDEQKSRFVIGKMPSHLRNNLTN
ncbi:hypothetical protein [Bradyrhizobium sp. AZCC 2230]|uniref:hypothetical protein n=1 Tax=Bradyrhizobium sp. AZCC 2230 TaxID=3117021 RepID=UPI002FF42472